MPLNTNQDTSPLITNSQEKEVVKLKLWDDSKDGNAYSDEVELEEKVQSKLHSNKPNPKTIENEKDSQKGKFKDGKREAQSEEKLSDEQEEDDRSKEEINTNPTVEELEKDKKDAYTEEEQTEYGVWFEYLKEKGLIEVGEDFEFNNTEEGLIQALDLTRETIKSKEIEALADQLPEDGKALLQYLLNGGQNVSEFQQVFSNNIDYDNVDMSDEDNQREILRLHYQATTDFSPDKIEKHVERSSQTGDLEEESQEAIVALKQIEENQKKNYLIQQKQDNQERLRLAREAQRIITDKIDKSEVLGNLILTKKYKDELKPFIYSSVVSQGNTPTTPFQSKLNEYLHNPDKFITLAAHLMTDFNPKDTKDIKSETKATKSVLEKLKTASKSEGRALLSGGRTTQIRDKKEFSLEEAKFPGEE